MFSWSHHGAAIAAFLGCRFHADKPCYSYCINYTPFLHSRKGRSGRTHRDRNVGRRHRSGRAAWRRGPRGQPHFCLATERICGPPPPVGGTFWFQIFIQAPSPEVWRKSISGGEGGCWRGNGVACFWATSFGKNYRRRDRDRLVPPRWMDTAVYRAEVCYLSVGSTGVTSSEAARVHIACRRCGGGVAASGASATAGDACGRVREWAVAGLRCLSGGRLPPGLAGLNRIATVSNDDGDYCRRHPQATGRDIRCAGEKHGHFPLDER